MKKKLIIGAIIVILLGIAAFIYIKNKGKGQEMMEAPPEFPTVVAELGDVERTVYASGNVDALSTEEIRAEGDSKVKGIFVRDGQVVKAGDLLFTLEENDESLGIKQEELNYQIKLRELNKEKKYLTSSTIKATAGGEVAEVPVTAGTDVDVSTVVAKVKKTGYFKAVLPFNVNDVSLFTVGQKVNIYIIDFMNEVEAKVVKIDKGNRAYKDGGVIRNITFEIKNPGALQEGQTASVNTVIKDRNVVSVEYGKLESPDLIEIKANTKGKIDEVLISKDDEVNQGDVLITLDRDAQSELKIDKELALEQAKLSLETKKKELDRYKVYAQNGGKVSNLTLKVGQKPSSDKPALILNNTSGLIMKVKIDEIDIPYIKLNQKAIVYVNAFNEEQFPAVVSKISDKGIVDSNNVTFEAELKLLKTDKLKPGMTGDVDIFLEKKSNVVRLPLDAITIEEDGVGTVMIKGQDGNPEPKTVKIGIEGQQYVEIIEGLKAGDSVLMMPK